MNVRSIKRELGTLYPHANIIVTTKIAGKATELIAELGLSDDGRSSTAIAVIDQNQPHRHQITVEEYIVERGTLKLNIDGVERVLHVGDKIVITPGQYHYAEGNATWVRVASTPAWRPDDYFI